MPKITLENGTEYVGQWKNCKKEGKGVQVWPDTSRYEGDWKEDKANGNGKFLLKFKIFNLYCKISYISKKLY